MHVILVVSLFLCIWWRNKMSDFFFVTQIDMFLYLTDLRSQSFYRMQWFKIAFKSNIFTSSILLDKRSASTFFKLYLKFESSKIWKKWKNDNHNHFHTNIVVSYIYGLSILINICYLSCWSMNELGFHNILILLIKPPFSLI